MKIPVFHDDQHGTAIIVGAAILNGLRVVGKEIGEVKLVCSGAGAAALACLDLLVALGIKRENIWVADIEGVVYARPHRGDGRQQGALRADDRRAHARRDPAGRRHLPRPVGGARAEARVAARRWPTEPLILALANPEPEIMPDVAKAARPDAVIATGRSDFPNQVNNVLCFPFIFRGALDVGATTINEAMKLACRARDRRPRDGRAVGHRRARLRRREPALRPRIPDPEAVRSAPHREDRAGGREGGDGLAAWRRARSRDFDAYRAAPHAVRLPLRPADEADLRGGEGRRRSASSTPRARTSACCAPCRSSSTRGSRGRSWSAGRRCIEQRIERFGLRIEPGKDFEIINPEHDAALPRLLDRVLPADASARACRRQYAKIEMRRRHTLIGAMMIHTGDADGMLCGTFGTHELHLHYIDQVIGLRRGVEDLRGDERGDAADAHGVHRRHLRQRRSRRPSRSPRSRCSPPRRSAASASRRRSRCCRTRASARSDASAGAEDARGARAASTRMDPDLEVEGEMHGDAALDEEVRHGARSRTRGSRARRTCSIMPTRRRGEHRVQPAQGRRRRRRHARADPARRRRSPCTSSRRRRRCAASST